MSLNEKLTILSSLERIGKKYKLMIMKEELNIAAILKGKPKTKVWSDAFGELTLEEIREDKEYPILLISRGYYDIELTNEGYYFHNIDGITPCIVPSKQMRDWSKFAWKKGDVLSCGVDNLCIFDKWENDEYTEFNAEFVTPNYSGAVLKTIDWAKVTNEDTIKQHISKIEEIKGGKLNLSTLDIEHSKPEFKDGDIVYIGNAFNEYIGILKETISDNRIKMYAHCHKKEKEARIGRWLNKNDSDVLRSATDSEKQQLFDVLAKEGKKWNPDTLQIEDLPKECEFKAFDKVLARFEEELEWMPDFFYYYDNTDKEMPYVCIANGRAVQCIPYNDQTKHLIGTTDVWKGGEG